MYVYVYVYVYGYGSSVCFQHICGKNKGLSSSSMIDLIR